MKTAIIAAALFAVSGAASAQEQSFTQFQINQLQEQVKELQEFVKRAGKTENWAATGIFITKVNGKVIDVKPTHWDGFDSAGLCWAAVGRYSNTDEYVGEGGSDGHVEGAKFNFDGDCAQKRK